MNNLTRILIGILILSIVFNFVFSTNLKKEFNKKEEKFNLTIEKKEQSIETLKKQLDRTGTKQNDEAATNTDDSLATQNQYKDVANQFIHAYLDYSIKNQGERRTNLLTVTKQEIVDMIAPDTKDLGDPNFKSSVDNVSIYVETATDISQKCKAIVNVEYTITGSENGQTKLRSLVELTLEKQENAIKVTDFNTHSMK